ncbi:MAG: DUF3365 domain-containing protein [Opitutae bacterium]|nr:DUF3365 domain-containing protein [Opitutae bacterium]
MKMIPAFLFLPLLLGSSLLGAAPLTPITDLKFTWADPDDPAVAEIRQTGEYAIQHIGNRMILEVRQVLAAKGAEDGIDILHLKDLKLPQPAPGKPHVTSVRRTSLKVRHLANAPDNADLAALLSIQKDLMDGTSPPKVLVQHIAADGATAEEWRVYRPISVMSSCLVCHGPSDSLLPSVKAKLERLYPEDKAVNYTAYEWRGVIRVSVSTAPAKKP